MRQLFPNVFEMDDQRIVTPNYAPGIKVYDEELYNIQGAEYRTWNPSKSKLGAYVMKGGRDLAIDERSRVLYLGAANGTTPSHVSDILSKGILYAVEFSPRSYRDLLMMSENRDNIVPVLADAWRPELYERFIGKVDLLFQDIAQRQQAAIFAKNINRFKPAAAMLAIKARSVDVAKEPHVVYREVCDELEASTGYDVIEMVDLGPFERDHSAIVMRPRGTAKRLNREGGGQRQYDDRDNRGGGRQDRGDFRGGDRRGGGGGGYRGGGGGGQRDDRGGRPSFQRRDDQGGGRPSGGGGDRNERRFDRRGGGQRDRW